MPTIGIKFAEIGVDKTGNSKNLIYLSNTPTNAHIYSVGVLLNPLAPELFFFLILAHPLYKILIIQEPNTVEL